MVGCSTTPGGEESDGEKWIEFGGFGGSFNSRTKMCNKVDTEIEKSVSPWFRKCQHQACMCNFYSAL